MREEGMILLVEDRPDDVLLLLRSFKKAGIKSPIHVASDGEQAIAYLTGSGKYAHREQYPLPDLILLDLKIPKVDGFEVLRWIRTHRDLSSLRVVVLTSSQNLQDVNLAYSLGANSFLVKPMEFNQFVELSSFIADNWFLCSKAPQVRQIKPDCNLRNKKVLLRDRQSHRFYKGRGAWVGQKLDALDFERIELAETVASAEHLHSVDIILAYERPGCEITLPVVFPGVRRT